MELHRISVKYFVSDPDTVDLTAMIGLFHRWIQEKKLEGLPIDVADYRHVREGPGVVLVGHEFDYAMDMQEGRPGLCYVRKREMAGSLTNQLRLAFHGALVGCRLLQEEHASDLGVTFRTDEVKLTLVDRLLAPNGEATLEEAREEIAGFLEQLYEPAAVSFEPDVHDQRRPFSLNIHACAAADLNSLMERLSADAPSGIGGMRGEE